MQAVTITQIAPQEFSQLLEETIRRVLLSKADNAFSSSLHVVTPKKPVTTQELCDFLGVTEPTILRWRKKGKIPFITIGSAIRFNLDEVLKALEVNVNKTRVTV